MYVYMQYGDTFERLSFPLVPSPLLASFSRPLRSLKRSTTLFLFSLGQLTPLSLILVCFRRVVEVSLGK